MLCKCHFERFAYPLRWVLANKRGTPPHPWIAKKIEVALNDKGLKAFYRSTMFGVADKKLASSAMLQVYIEFDNVEDECEFIMKYSDGINLEL